MRAQDEMTSIRSLRTMRAPIRRRFNLILVRSPDFFYLPA